MTRGRITPQSILLLVAALAPYDGLLIIAPLPGIASAWKEGLIALALALCVLDRAGNTTRIPLPIWAIPAGVLAGWSAVSLLLHPSMQSVLGYKIGYTYLALPLVLWWRPFDPRDRDRLVSILMVNGLVTSLVGIGQQIVGDEFLVRLGYAYNDEIRFAGGLMRSISTFNQPFPFAFFVMVVILVCLPVALENRSRFRNRLFLASLPILMLGMMTAVVRGAILGLIVGLLYRGVSRYRVIAHALLPLPLAVVIVVASGAGTALFSASSLEERATGWIQVFDGQPLDPIGQGVGSTGSAAERFDTTGLGGTSPLSFGPATLRYQPDNHYVKTIVELGPIGLWLLVWVIVAIGVDARRVATATRDRADSGLAHGIVAATVAAAASATVATYLEIFPVDLFFWMLAGVTSSIRLRST